MARSAAALERRKLKVALHSYPELFIAARSIFVNWNTLDSSGVFLWG
jgi:hypothetical protein